MTRPGMRWLGAAVLLAVAASAFGATGEGRYDAHVYRIEGGIPYIVANDYGSLGYGTGYAMARDMPCLLAGQLLTFGAQRSRYLGNTQENRDSDFFYQLFIDSRQARQPVDPRQAEVFKGAAAGYNRYLEDTGLDQLPNPACRGAAWVRPVKAIDFRRISRMPFLLPFIKDMLVAAAPPPSDGLSVGSAAHDVPLTVAQIQQMVTTQYLVEHPDPGFGSNGIAIGADASADHAAMLLANPHQPWRDTERFYAFAQAIPGKFFVVGANILGRPQVAFGATEHVAWTSTVSTAPRMTFYRLQLVPGHPTEYLFDGKPQRMEKTTVTIQVAGEHGKLEPRTHTFYKTAYDAYLVGGKFPWNHTFAYAVRVAAKPGWRGVNALADIYAARSLREFGAVQDKYQFSPANVIAAGADGEVLYSDPGPTPDLDDQQRAQCEVPGGLDGSRSACMWRSSKQAAAPGLLPPEKLPHLMRRDYVANMNDSFWLANAAEPLSGYAKALGSTDSERTLRTRSGLYQIHRRLTGADGREGKRFSFADLQSLLTDNFSYTGMILRDGLVKLCQSHPQVTLAEKGSEQPVTVDIRAACPVLAQWDLRANLDSRGAVLFREFMNAGMQTDQRPDYRPILPSQWHYTTAFNVDDPVNTPRGLDAKNNPEALVALAHAVKLLRDAGVALDVPLGQVQYVTRNGERIPIPGGTNPDGVLNIIRAPFDAKAGAYPKVTGGSSSWIQVTEFTADGPKSRGVLTYSESPNPASPHYADQTRIFSRGQWIDLPFSMDALKASAKTVKHLEGPVSPGDAP